MSKSEITKEDLIRQIKRFISEYGRVPYAKDCAHCEFMSSKKTFGRKFGSFNDCLKVIGIKPNHRYRVDYDRNGVCNNCSISFKRKQENQKFCSRSCAATYNNKNRCEDNVIKHYCKYCESELSTKRKYCDSVCKIIFESKTTNIGELIRYKEQNRYRAIRDKCSNLYKILGRPNECQNCGYDKNIENCHVTPIQSFQNNDYVWDCNKPSNVVFLCKNCHWEFDHNYLSIIDIKTSEFYDYNFQFKTTKSLD